MATEPGTTATTNAAHVRDRLTELRQRIDAAGGHGVSVLAVTKAFGLDAVIAAHEVGLDAVGENYANELVEKAADPRSPAQTAWHFIGRLQSNKIKDLAPYVSVWQSVDRPKVAERIARLAPGATVYVQMRPRGLALEAQKGGAPYDEVPALVGAMRDLGLQVAGIMTVGVAGDAEGSAQAFGDAVELADRLDLRERSMGMTDDLELAIASGSTMVRVGSGLFGSRPTHSQEPRA